MTEIMKQSPKLSSLVLLILVASLAGPTGCRMQTRKAAREEQDRLQSQARAEEERLRSEQEKERLSEEQKRLEREVARFDAKRARDQKLVEARRALSGGEPEKTLALTEEMLEPISPETAGDPEYVGPPPLTTAELARIRETRALAAFDLGKTTRAVEEYRQVLELDPGSRKARKNLGRILYKEKRYAEALEVFRLELEDGFRPTDILFLIGRCHYEIGRREKKPGHYEAARIAMKDAVLADPTDVDMLRWLAYLEFQTGRFEESIRLLETLRQQFPLDPEYLELLANSCIQLDRTEPAIEYLELAASLRDPDRQDCLSLGDLHARAGKSARAAEWFRRAHGDDPEKAPAADCVYLARLLVSTGNYREALRWLTAVGVDDEVTHEARAIESTVYLELGEEEKALAAFQAMSRARPMDCLPRLAAGDILLDRGELDQARSSYAAAALIEECEAEGLAGLAEVQYRRKDLAGAIRYYEQALEKSPENPRFLVALRQIRTEHEVQESAPTPAGPAD